MIDAEKTLKRIMYPKKHKQKEPISQSANLKGILSASALHRGGHNRGNGGNNKVHDGHYLHNAFTDHNGYA